MAFVRSINSRQVSSVTSKTTGTLASAAASGEIVFLTIYLQNGDSGSRVVTWPSGFTELYLQHNFDSSGHTHGAAYKVASGSEPTSYSYSWTTTANVEQDWLAVYDTIDNATPIGTSPASSNNTWNNSHTVNSITTSVDGETALHTFAGQGAVGSVTPSSGWTERQDSNDLYVMELVKTPAGLIAPGSITHNYTETGSATFAFNPASVGGDPEGPLVSGKLTGGGILMKGRLV